jgi:hypothetical protein
MDPCEIPAIQGDHQWSSLELREVGEPSPSNFLFQDRPLLTVD